MIKDLETFSSCCPAAAVEEADGGLLNTDGTTLSRPSRKQIKAAAQAAYDKCWYAGHVQLGRPEIGEKSAQGIEVKYGKDALDSCDACLLRLEGRLGALRWVLHGAPINNFDT
jgi:hypothetical protein